MVYIKNALKKIWTLLIWPYTYIKQEIKFRKRMKELKQRDPFIYK
tara:strand:+ start:2470 stop:2604 length:135 start_codon:yes stop_codon:yes gene_type:complete